jgi:putative ABC transport system permease protein
MARLRPGVTREQAQAAGTLLVREAMRAEPPSPAGDDERRIAQTTLELRPAEKGFGGLNVQFAQPLTVLMVMVGVVLLIACANLANLLLARGSARQREISVRMAVGAGRGRVVQQLFTESLLLAVIGGAAAVAVAWWGSGALFRMVSESRPTMRIDVAPDLRTFLFTGAVTVLTALLFGMLPALRATRVDVSSALKDGGRSAPQHGRLGRLLVGAQVMLSVILLMGTGLFARTLYNMKAQDLGYSPQDLILMRVDPTAGGYRGDEIGQVAMTLLERLRTVPGLTSITFSENGLFSGTESGARIRIDGYTPAKDDDASVRFDQVGPRYFTHVGIPLLLGRDIDETDRGTGTRGIVINENMARFYFGDANPIGRVVHYEGRDPFVLTIVGVSKNARDHGLREDVERRMYVSFLQPVDGVISLNYELRTSVRPVDMNAQLRAAVRDVSPRIPVVSIKALTTLIDETLLQERIIARLSAVFGLVAVGLASVGLYGVLAYSVTRRTNEIGIRMAVGAFSRDIVWMVLRETMGLVVLGIAIGLPVALALSRFIESLLFGLRPNDALTIAGVVGLMLCIALLAAAGPARRAARVDPLRALRYE